MSVPFQRVIFTSCTIVSSFSVAVVVLPVSLLAPERRQERSCRFLQFRGSRGIPSLCLALVHISPCAFSCSSSCVRVASKSGSPSVPRCSLRERMRPWGILLGISKSLSTVPPLHLYLADDDHLVPIVNIQDEMVSLVPA